MLLRLEDEVGAELFNRTARGVTLTEPGRIFIEHARQLLGGVVQALEDVRQLDLGASGQVVFAVPPSIARLIGARLVEELSEHAPKVRLRLVDAYHGAIRGWIEPGKIDLGLMHDLGPLRHLSSRSLVSEELYLAGAPGQFGDDASDLPDIPFAGLGNFPLISPGPPHGLRQLIEHEAGRLGYKVNIVQESDCLAQTLDLVEAGRFNAVLSFPAIEEALSTGRMSAARIGEGALRRSLCLVRNPAQLVTHASLRVEDIAIRIITDLIESGAWNARLEASEHQKKERI